MVIRFIKTSFTWLFVLCVSLSTVESVVVHFLAENGIAIESLAELSGEEDSKKEEKKEKEETEKEKDKFFSRNRNDDHLTGKAEMVLLHVLSEHQFESEVDSPPPEFIFS